jgi:DNA-directed RNA polymerase delta subunit
MSVLTEICIILIFPFYGGIFKGGSYASLGEQFWKLKEYFYDIGAYYR